MRRHLKKIGLTSDLSQMSFHRALLLEQIGNEFDRLEVAEMKKKTASTKQGAKHRGR